MGVVDIVLLFVGQDIVNHRGSNKISWFLLGNITYSGIIIGYAIEILFSLVKISLMVNMMTKGVLLLF